MIHEGTLDRWNAEIRGFTAETGPQRMSSPVALDDEACVRAEFVTHRGNSYPFESADVTALVQCDNDTLQMIAKLATRLAKEAFRAGVRYQQQRVADALGLALTPMGD